MLAPIAFFDSPEVINTKITPIPAASADPLQVIANTGVHHGVGMMYSDSTGSFIGVYVGEKGFESLACIIGNGLSSQAWAHIPPRSRISLRSMSNIAVTAGQLSAVVVKSI